MARQWTDEEIARAKQTEPVSPMAFVSHAGAASELPVEPERGVVEKRQLKRLPISHKADALRERLRQIPLTDRLAEIPDRISKMCSRGRPPRMSIPVQWDDDDWFITYTVQDALAALVAQPTTVTAVEDVREAAGKLVAPFTSIQEGTWGASLVNDIAALIIAERERAYQESGKK